jgi:hypothetical protein
VPFRNSLDAAAAAHLSWARTTDRAARTAPATAALQRSLEQRIDPDGVMTLENRRKAVRNFQRASALKASMAAADKRRALREAKERQAAESDRREREDLQRPQDAAVRRAGEKSTK